MAIEKTFGSVPGKKLGDKDALGDIERFERGEPNPDETNGRRTETSPKPTTAAPSMTDEIRFSKGSTPITVDDSLGVYGQGKTTAIPQEAKIAPEQPHNLENAVEKLANNAIPADLTEKTGVDRTKMRQDITGILAELLKKDPSLLEDRKRLAETSANKFLEQPRGKEDLNTAEGRVAEGLRSYADKRAGFAVGDDIIKGGVPFVEEGLTTKIGKALDPKAMKNLQQALVLDDTVKSPNPNATAQEAEEPAKDGKGSGGKKNWLEALLDIIKPLLVALGFMEDEPKKDTAVAANNPPANGKSADGKTREQEQQTQLTPEEQKKSLAYLKELGDDFQKSIDAVRLKDTGIMLGGLPKEFTPQAQIIGAKLPASDIHERG